MLFFRLLMTSLSLISSLSQLLVILLIAIHRHIIDLVLCVFVNCKGAKLCMWCCQVLPLLASYGPRQ